MEEVETEYSTLEQDVVHALGISSLGRHPSGVMRTPRVLPLSLCEI